MPRAKYEVTQLHDEVTELAQRITAIEGGHSATISRMEALERHVEKSTREIGSLKAANARFNETIERLTVKIGEVNLGETSQTQTSNNEGWQSQVAQERRTRPVTPPRSHQVSDEGRARGIFAGSHAQYRGSVTGTWGCNEAQ